MDTSSQKYTLLTGSKVIDGNGGRPIEDGVILMEEDEIKAVGQKGSISIPEGADINEIDYQGMTILPGLIDCHVHLIGIGDGRSGDELSQVPDEVLTLQAAQNAEAHLFSGVTTVRDLGAKNRTTFMLRLGQQMGIANTPRLILSGRPIAIVAGHLSYFGTTATGTVEGREAVRQLLGEGADFIKITATGGSTKTSVPGRPSFNVD
ncbi:MAG: amidohydrolase family protein, partial [SAR202 cluster bacterium]|nr:amidohydrolase family protein [SAR202 cluster bacterium]